MSLSILVANRITKLLGNIIKGVGYIVHLFAPKLRFDIPKQSHPLRKSDSTQAIPRIFWQTNYTNRVSLPVYINYLYNRLMSLDYEYRYASDDDILEFFETQTAPEELKAYKQLKDGAAKADFWRLAVLYHIGGVYLDIDASFVWPLSKQIKPEEREIFLLNKEHYTNYFMATAPKNPIYKKAMDIVVDNIKNSKTDNGVYALTGPGVVNLAIGDQKVNHRLYRYTCVQGAFTNEHFHYIDKRQGKWIHTKKEDILQ